MKEIRQIIIDLCQAENYLEAHKPNGFMNNLIEAHGAIGNLLNIELAKRVGNLPGGIYEERRIGDPAKLEEQVAAEEQENNIHPNDDVVATVE